MNREQHALHIGVEGLLVVLFGDRAQRHHFTATRIGENHVDLRVLLLNSIVKPVDIGQAGHVTAHARHSATDLLQSGVKRLLAAAGDEDRCAFRGKCRSRRQPDPAGAAGDHNNLVRKPVHRLSP